MLCAAIGAVAGHILRLNLCFELPAQAALRAAEAEQARRERERAAQIDAEVLAARVSSLPLRCSLRYSSRFAFRRFAFMRSAE